MSDPAKSKSQQTESRSITKPPFLQLFNFLEPHALERLLLHVDENLDSMEPSQVTDGPLLRRAHNESLRRSRIDSNVETVWPLLEGSIVPLFPHLRRELGTGWFELGSIERQLTVHRDGDFFTQHVDDAQPMTDGARMITFVYYFNAEPKEFEGGELRLFDTLVTEEGLRQAADSYLDIEPASNSIVFFAADSFHEVRPVRQTGGGKGASRCTVNGWFHVGDIGRLRAQLVDLSALTVLASRVLPRITECGFSLRPTPATVQDRLAEHLELHRTLIHSEDAPKAQFPTGTPNIIPLKELGTELLHEMQELHEQWAGVPLRPVAAFGMRVFGPGCTQKPSIEHPATHVISSMLFVETDLDSPWPLLFDHDSRRHELHPSSGQMILYEGASMPQARPAPLRGRATVVVYLHYCPTEWNYSTTTIVEDAFERGLIDEQGVSPPSDRALDLMNQAISPAGQLGLVPRAFQSSTANRAADT